MQLVTNYSTQSGESSGKNIYKLQGKPRLGGTLQSLGKLGRLPGGDDNWAEA